MALADSNAGGMGTSRTLVDLVLARRERGSVREIEAILQNLHKRQQRNDALRERGEISEAEAIVPTELARVLVAQLQEMEDEFAYARDYTRKLASMAQETLEKQEEGWKRLEGIEDAKGKARIQQEVDSLARDLSQLRDESNKAEREFALKKSREGRIHDLIQWANERFKF